jgi:hypothetical protein
LVPRVDGKRKRSKEEATASLMTRLALPSQCPLGRRWVTWNGMSPRLSHQLGPGAADKLDSRK